MIYSKWVNEGENTSYITNYIFLPTVNALKIVPCKKGNKEQKCKQKNSKQLINLKALIL